MTTYGGLSSDKSGMLSVQIASLNSPSEVIKSIFVKLYTLFFNGVYSSMFLVKFWENRRLTAKNKFIKTKK